MANCSNCGEAYEGNPRFCPNCGAPLNPEDAQATNNMYNRPQNVPAAAGTNSGTPGSTIAFMILTLIGGIMCVAGVFLPYVKATAWVYNVEYSFQDLAKSDYVIFVAVGAICVVFGLFKLYLLGALGGILYAIMFYVDSHDYWENLKSDSRGAMASKGAGYYCMLIGCIILIVFGLSGFIMKLKNKKSR